ncbi:MAG TPA: hypothetical protein D7I10_03570 [Candidatus Poseidoniales archaeon]|nr:MAG TPA: hypothetical protein D7I10_03570 [Candidatus Poseidoniales archaeon]HIH81504.1 hypothetical protein [Candidatus Thalassarchaeaceae archaeon]
MRGRSFCLTIILLCSLLLPVATTPVSASLEELGSAGKVAEFDHAAIGWWELDNGNILIATPEGVVTAYFVHENGTYAEVWSDDTNTSVNCADFNSAEGLLALGTTSGVVVVSVDYMEELYRFTVNEAVDGVAWDRDGDLWATKRLSKNAIEWDGSASTLSGISTVSSHTNGITDVVTLSDGKILTSGRDKQIRIHDENGSFIQSLADSTAPLLKLGVSHDETFLFSLTDNCRLDIHNTSTWVREQSINLCSNGQGRSLEQLDQRLMMGMSNGRVFSLDIDTLAVTQDFSVQGEVTGFRQADGEGVFIFTSFGSTSEIHLLDADRDDDGVVDGLDEFPDDPNESVDSDGDGMGDNADWAPNDASETMDSDNDGVGDNGDAFPNNSAQQTDSDGDGYGDNKFGVGGDKFPEDSTQWADSDGDGYGDNDELGATNPDACPNQSGGSTIDRLGCQDTDGDGYSDPGNGVEAHPVGIADAFHLESTQHYDSDGDGYGDNLTGYRGDACPTLAGTSTRANMYDPGTNSYTSISRYGCVDEDGDGYDDNTESTFGDCSMANNRSEWLDEDRDCLGSNADYDDGDPEIKTLEDHCNKYPDDIQACTDAYDPNSDSENITLLEDEEFDAMGAIKEFAVIAGYIVAAMALVLPVIVITLRSIGKARDKRKPDAQYTHQDATQELDAWESGDTFETRGGIDEQKVWGEDPLEDEESSIEGPAIEELGPEEEESSEPEYVAEQMSIPSQEEEVEESSEQPEQPPAEAPPLPSGGLPEGWTMDQWRWYGHQWLERHGKQ